MQTQFLPIEYDYFDWQGRNYARIIGRDKTGKQICVIDTCPVYLWAILKDNTSQKQIDKLIKEISKIELDSKGRKTRVEKVEIHNKNFLSKPVKALKIFATNYKDLHEIADHLDFEEIEKRRGYDLGFTTHYIIESQMIPLKWYEISGEILNNSEDFGKIDSALEVDYTIKLDSKKPAKKEETIFEPKVLAYDIETDDFKIGEGEILMVSLVGKNFKKVITWKHDKSNSKPDYVEFVKDEAELIEKFVKEIKSYSPDFLVGYFSDSFDLPYLRERASKNGIKLNLGLDGSQPKFSRGGFGTLTAEISGLVHIDLLKFIRTAYAQYMKSETLTLNEVAKEFLGDAKKDFKLQHSSKIEKKDWVNYYEYNLHDSFLTLQLFEKFWPDMLEFTITTQEPIFEISRAGLSKYTESYILHHLNEYNEIPEKKPGYNESSERRESMSVEGAFVFQPTPGIYENIAMFDFTSMHTSIIITHNISKSTLLSEKPKGKDYFESPEVEFQGKKTHFYFSKKPGFLPEMLKDIFEKRKHFKEEYKKNPNPITLARSNAFKVLSASAHGYIGFFGARYYSLEASASVLAFVRKFNKETIDKVEKAGYKVIFGDSISGKTKIIIKNKDKVYEEDIGNLFEKIDEKNPQEKEYNFKSDMEVLTLDKQGNSIFKPIKYIMRHKCNKKMYRVHFTNNWNIDVTEDHSLIGYQAYNFNQSNKNKENPLNRIIEVKPAEIKNKLNSIISLKKIPNNNIISKNYPKEVYELMGLFIGDGSFSRNKWQKANNKDYCAGISLGTDKEELLNKVIKPLREQGHIKTYWESKIRNGDIKFNGLELIKILANDFREKNGKKTIPEWLFNEKEENIASFLRGLFSADGTVMIRNKAPIIKYTSILEDNIIKVRKLLYKLGISHSIYKENTPNIYKTKNKTYSTESYSKNIIIQDKLTFNDKVGFLLDRKNIKSNIPTNSSKRKNIGKFEFDLQSVAKIEEIETPEYVYDLEVEETHRFFANYVLVHNTDSTAFLMNNHTKQDILNLLKKINNELPGVMKLELEGFFKRGIWVSKRTGDVGAKKKYALLDENNKLKIRGFETVRRDWCDLARKTQNHIIKTILEDGNEKNAVIYIKDIIKKLKAREIPLETLIIKSQLTKPLNEYKAITPHVIAAQKMKEQNTPIEHGDLIKFYIAEPEAGKEKSKLVRDRVKLPEEQGKYDIEYYLNKQLLPAVENILQVFNIDAKTLTDGKKQMKLGDF